MLTAPLVRPLSPEFMAAQIAPWLGGFKRPTRLKFALTSPKLSLTLGSEDRTYLTTHVVIAGIAFPQVYCQVPFGRH